MNNEEATSDLVYCTYVLNGEPLSRLVCDGVSYDAFSGDASSYVNDVRYQDVPKFGPLPLGKYYILDRESGGAFGWIIQPSKDYWAGTDRSSWLSLYRDDGVIDDTTLINGTQRGAFRIHPIGPAGISEGCVTLFSPLAFELLRTYIRSRSGKFLPGKSVKYYGILEVIEEKSFSIQ
ncbi:Protein of unknown function [Pseudomonas sp. NFACC02]|uniref:DUF2778 domain-containing protein n=1 Tax=Pseudomonas sp. NFACC02 TaxID=1566250 RepID=UPI0008D6AF17|nr:DUF2778 domain-containing protein [Pseudomonas sp. NFACC02]SER71765.1 Protein of unknown function [Pseudomonas sp. NFACC02]